MTSYEKYFLRPLFTDKVNECSDPSRESYAVNVDLGFKAGVIGDVGGTIDSCDSGNPDEAKNCLNIAEVSGETFVGLVAPGSLGVRSASDVSCGSNCTGLEFGPLTADATATATIKIGLWKFSFNGKKSLQLTDKYSFGGSGCGA